MGMDVYGIKPKNEKGEYFRASVWYWHPLWNCLDYLYPKICEKVQDPHSNSGDGLNARDSLALSTLLKKDLDSGLIESYINQYHEQIDSLPLLDCEHCEGLGVRTWLQENGSSETKTCNACNGTLKVASFATYYKMDLGLMREFQVFLENCRGFQIC